MHEGEQWSSEDGGEGIELETQPDYALGASFPQTHLLRFSQTPQEAFDTYTAYDRNDYAPQLEGGAYQQPPGRGSATPPLEDLGYPQEHPAHI